LELEVFVVHFTSVLHFALGFQNLANWNIEVAKANEINQDSTNNGRQQRKKKKEFFHHSVENKLNEERKLKKLKIWKQSKPEIINKIEHL
jgi:hypothetical protein